MHNRLPYSASIPPRRDKNPLDVRSPGSVSPTPEGSSSAVRLGTPSRRQPDTASIPLRRGPDGSRDSDRQGGEPPPRRPDGETPPKLLTIAVVTGSWGLRGEVRVRLETDFPERFARLKSVYLGPKRQPFEFEGFRQHGDRGLLKLKGCDNPEAAKLLSGLEVQIPVAEAMPLPPGRYYEFQLKGLNVYTEDGESLGVLEEVLFTGSNAVYVVCGPRGEVLLPVLKDVVLQVDLEAGRMIVRLPPGLID